MPSYTVGLTPLDHLAPRAYTCLHFLFRTDEPERIVTLLQDGLAETAQQLPFITGLIWKDAKRGNRTMITWNDEDLHLPFREIDVKGLPSYAELEEQGMLLQHLPHELRPVEVREQWTKSKPEHPAMVVAYTKIEGGLIFTFAQRHELVDGTGRETLFDAFARNVRRDPVKTLISPDDPLTREKRLAKILSILQARDQVGQAASTNGVTTATTNGSLAITGLPDPTAPLNGSLSTKTLPDPWSVPRSLKFFFFSISKLSSLREKIQIEPQATRKPSINVTFVSLLWRAISKARVQRLQATVPDFDPTSVSKLLMAFNMRPRLRQEGLLTSETPWIGNFIFASRIPVGVPLSTLVADDQADDEFSHASLLAPVAEAIATNFASLTGQSWLETTLPLMNVCEQPEFDWDKIGHMPHLFNGLHFAVTTAPEVHPYPDFGPGIGRFQYVRPGMDALDGICMRMPRKRGSEWTEEEQDTLEVQLWLREDDMEVVCKDQSILKYLKRLPC